MTTGQTRSRSRVAWEPIPRVVGLIASLLLCGAVGLLLVLLVVRAANAQVPGATGSQGSGSAGVRIVESTTERIVLEIDLPQYAVTQKEVGDQAYDLLSIPGWGLTQVSSMPQLPTKRLLLAVPPEAELQLEVLDATVQEDGLYRILPAPEMILRDDLSDAQWPWFGPPQFETRYTESPAGYAADSHQPAAVVRVAEVAWLRSQRIAAVEVFPILYSPGSGRIHFYRRFRVEISFSYPSARGVAGSEAIEEPASYEQLWAEELLNYRQAQAWRSSQGLSDENLGPSRWPFSSDAYKITITENGIYQLTYDTLLEGGFAPETLNTLDPQTFQVSWMGQEIAIQVIGEEDHSFDQGDYVLFYGQGISDKYTDRNVYWLTYGQFDGRRMKVRSGAPAGGLPSPAAFLSNARIEEDRAYLAQWPGDDSTDRWYWRAIFSPPLTPEEPSVLSAEADLGHVSAESMSSTLWISMMGLSSVPSVLTDHHALFYVNDHLVGEHWWDGADTVEWVRADFPQGYLNSGINTFRTEFPGVSGVPLERVLFDRYELAYWHAYRADSDQLEFSQSTAGSWDFEVDGFTGGDIGLYDISEPLTVSQIVNTVIETNGSLYKVRFSDTVPSTRTYLALTPLRWLEPANMAPHTPAGLHYTSNAADYIIISHAEFLQAAHQLAAYRSSQGLRTFVVDVQDIYDEFGYGLSTPHAIRDFVRYAYASWQPPAPAYLVLLGDGTYDPKNHLNQGAVSYLTPYLGFVDLWLGETATDNWFVAVSGEDILPDLHLGRLPANSLSEALTMVGKIIDYEQAAGGADWANRLTFAAGLQPDPKGAGDFHAMSDAVISETVPAHYDVTKIYRGTVAGATCATVEACQAQLLGQINAGTALVNFIGHGSVIQWDSILFRSMVTDGSFQNPETLPVMLPMTCLDGYFIQAQRPDPAYPDYPSLSELLVRTPDKGAVASWGPTGLGVAYGHDQLDRGFLEALLLKGIRELGPATYAGKLRLYQAGYSLEQIQEYTIFGDPALRIKSPDADLRVTKSAEAPQQIAPGDIVTFTLVFTNAGPGIAFDVTLTDLLPTELASPAIVFSTPEVISQYPSITFAWAITDLWPHTGGEVRIRAEVDAGAGRLSFFNTATISSSTPDLNPGNNRSRAGVGTKGMWLPLILKSH